MLWSCFANVLFVPSLDWYLRKTSALSDLSHILEPTALAISKGNCSTSTRSDVVHFPHSFVFSNKEPPHNRTILPFRTIDSQIPSRKLSLPQPLAPTHVTANCYFNRKLQGVTSISDNYRVAPHLLSTNCS